MECPGAIRFAGLLMGAIGGWLLGRRVLGGGCITSPDYADMEIDPLTFCVLAVLYYFRAIVAGAGAFAGFAAAEYGCEHLWRALLSVATTGGVSWVGALSGVRSRTQPRPGQAPARGIAAEQSCRLRHLSLKQHDVLHERIDSRVQMSGCWKVDRLQPAEMCPHPRRHTEVQNVDSPPDRVGLHPWQS